MGLLCRIITFSVLLQACLGVKVTLERAQTGTAQKSAIEKSDVTLPCFAQTSTNSAGSPIVEWTYDTVPNTQGTHLYYTNQDENTPPRIQFDPPYSLIIQDLRSSDSGFYKCRVTMLQDNPSVDAATYNFTVLVPPYEEISCGFPGDLKITLGQSTSFKCREVVAQAVPAPTYTWFKNGVELPTSRDNLPQYANSSFSYSKLTGILEFSSVKSGDAGTYHCTVSNEVGSPQSCQQAAITTKDQDVGLIVGIVFAVIFGLLLIAVLIWWTWRKGYCDNWFGGKEAEEDAPDDGANDIMLDGAGPLVTKEPSEWSNGTSNKNSIRSTEHRMPEGAVRVMP